MIRWLILTKFNCFMNKACLWAVRAFINPSATISLVDTHWIDRLWLATSCRSQCWCISICFSLVISFGESLIIRPIICRLLQWTVSSCLISRLILRKRRPYYKSQALICESAKSLALVVNVVTIACFLLCQSIIPPNSWKIDPLMLCRVIGLSA